MRMLYILKIKQIFKKEKITSVGKNMEKSEPLCTARANAKWCSCCGNSMAVPQNLNPQNYCTSQDSTRAYILKRSESRISKLKWKKKAQLMSVFGITNKSRF